MKERLIHLKVKVKSLAAEAVIIRQEARKVSGDIKHNLNLHRTGIVRHHARHNQLAYGLLRGVAYARMEQKCDIKPDFKLVGDLAKRFGGTEEEIIQWIKEAKFYLKLI